jgi:translation initiation factor 2 subunit 2
MQLLSRVFNIIRKNNPDFAGDRKRYTVPAPQVVREGTKKTLFANVVDMASKYAFD